YFCRAGGNRPDGLNEPVTVVAIYADYKTRWPAMADVSESVVVGQKIDNISLDEFAKALKSVLARI
ncbi:hypothetical protein H3281_23915, partial [Escherichia coli]|nr:hypothetical protein [Escherichia coli]MBA5818771.1 hypothetical protein [Escherichia coli]